MCVVNRFPVIPHSNRLWSLLSLICQRPSDFSWDRPKLKSNHLKAITAGTVRLFCWGRLVLAAQKHRSSSLLHVTVRGRRERGTSYWVCSCLCWNQETMQLIFVVGTGDILMQCYLQFAGRIDEELPCRMWGYGLDLSN